ncbi:MAG: DUF1844 domain-containing protein [Myxococcota bacterium]|nr:DUF1844 domain-containing protein [Myxococcota bacterium]
MSAPVSFAQFLVSLGSSAMVHLGETADPASGDKRANPMMAKHTLDVLELLRTKTRGNLDDDEARLLDALITEVSDKLASLPG